MLEFEIFDKGSTVQCGINVRAGPSTQPASHCQVSLQYIHYPAPAPAPWPRQTLDTADTRGQVWVKSNSKYFPYLKPNQCVGTTKSWPDPENTMVLRSTTLTWTLTPVTTHIQTRTQASAHLSQVILKICCIQFTPGPAVLSWWADSELYQPGIRRHVPGTANVSPRSGWSPGHAATSHQATPPPRAACHGDTWWAVLCHPFPEHFRPMSSDFEDDAIHPLPLSMLVDIEPQPKHKYIGNLSWRFKFCVCLQLRNSLCSCRL